MNDLIASLDWLDALLLIILVGKIIYELVLYFRLKSGKYAISGNREVSKYCFGSFFGMGIYLVLRGLIDYGDPGINYTLIIGILYLLLFTYRLNRYDMLFKKGYFIFREFGYPYMFKYKSVKKVSIDNNVVEIYTRNKHITTTLQLPEQENTKDFLVRKLGNKVTVF